MTGLDVARDRVVEVCIERVVGGRRVGACSARSSTRASASAAPRTSTGSTPPRSRARRASRRSPHERARRARRGDPGGARGGLGRRLPRRRVPPRRAARSRSTTGSTRSCSPAAPSRFHSYSLDALCRELGIDRGRAHRAESDVRAMRRRLRPLRRRASRPASARDLWEVRVGERRARPGHRPGLRGGREARASGRRHVPGRAPAARSRSPWSCSRSAPTSTRRALWGISSRGEAGDNSGPIASCASSPRPPGPHRENLPRCAVDRSFVLALGCAGAARRRRAAPSMGPQAPDAVAPGHPVARPRQGQLPGRRLRRRARRRDARPRGGPERRRERASSPPASPSSGSTIPRRSG